jgi:hypothetical protein
MVPPEPGEPLLLYIVATAEAVSMVLVTKRLDPHTPHELGSSPACGSGSQDPGLAKEPRAGEAAGSQPMVAPRPSTQRPLQVLMTKRSQGLRLQRSLQIQRIGSVIPRSEKERTKPPYVCPGCSNHTHGNNMINRCNVINKRVICLT